ncbi:small nuclear ribonucleoprotein [Ordospora colligata]|uniref:Small nuclear ribonucleoprotein n=1 Tax=Ordospora colligata OC4 TaxID=1354746 RepID=A0A0B2ULC8_9MICR|nr:small nuclear ribonucleoprotein [Ordospora colligata OC4]KHN70104.1 small nuclear ribonucleoprotein [Ordospora colligata OC4]TBU16486.1 small nuclear ribonucleoprotein [Ordospora colligata]TBU16671.1 small nuclear ribonucleoprotein [Ordospora colligata]TBU19244.1 small nuclear ribonucleoprotein [Ordospora colligata]
MAVSVPLRLLYESQGLAVSIETDSGCMYQGVLKEIDDYMNVELVDVSVYSKDGLQRKKEVFIRGSAIVLFVLPPALKFAPFLNKVK